ncbi:helix-turn-helix transcriptional regulator [Enterobacter roggenkampii]|uniref:helix-turn-helix transcriptional regulator n=1 Tax=Enterobacter roggenkampii TaxID=1812935 RepID=UPI002DBFAA76|nr:PAS domain-containing protein [Enterobacter roggenkampii]MEB5887471.1 PAS domain-containing protein [Enterobacter roggenkampii]
MPNERDQLIATLTASLEALRTTLAANTEVVLHDLTQPASSVVSIVNGHVSGRNPGDGLLSGPDDDTGFLGLLEPARYVPFRVFNDYTTKTSTGKVLNSASTIYYSTGGVPLVAFCINVDSDALNRLRSEIDSLFPPTASRKPGKADDSTATQSFDEILSRFRQTGAESNIQYRRRVVAELADLGFFKVKGSVNHVARVLGVSRYTIYNYLEKNDEKQ